MKRTKIIYRDEEGLTFMPEDLQEGKDFPRIKLASLEKLLEFLTHEKYSDSLLRFVGVGVGVDVRCSVGAMFVSFLERVL